MANKTRCLTPGAVFHTDIAPGSIKVVVDLPTDLQLTQAQAKLMETLLHNQVELVIWAMSCIGCEKKRLAQLVKEA